MTINDPPEKAVHAALAWAARGFRVFPCKNIPGEIDHKRPHTKHGFKDATTDANQIRNWWNRWPDALIGVPTGPKSGFWALDLDAKKGKDGPGEWRRLMNGYAMPVTRRHRSWTGGDHFIFAWRDDRPVKNSEGKIAIGIDTRGEGGYVIMPPSAGYSIVDDSPIVAAPDFIHDIIERARNGEAPDFIRGIGEGTIDDDQPTLDQIKAALAAIPPNVGDDVWSQISSSLHNLGVPFEIFHDWSKPAHNYQGRDDCLKKWNRPTQRRCGFGTLVHFADKYSPGWREPRATDLPPQREWPVLGEAAYHGPVGNFVKMVEPYSEADPVAIMIQMLVMVGNVVGRKVYFKVACDVHHCNEFVNLVGETSVGRKGVSKNIAIAPLRYVDESWHRNCVKTGASSGEGIIYNLRDRVVKDIATAADDMSEQEEELVDRGCVDQQKRLMDIEPEMTQVMTVAQRSGNTLATILMHGWDGLTLANLTSGRSKHPLTATDPHLSLIGHSTVAETRRTITATEIASGFANRIIFVLSRRSKLIARPKPLPESEFEKMSFRIRHNIDKVSGELDMTEEAWALWEDVYATEIEAPRFGLVGAMLGRGAAHVRRLAMIYAVVDGASNVEIQHLEAALAWWRYSEESVKYIFGDRVGNPTADAILVALKAGPLTQTEIMVDLFQKHRKASDVQSALQELLAAGLARPKEVKTAGRPAMKWTYTGGA
jgi:hypothetical protein